MPKNILDLLSTEVARIVRNDEVRDGFVRGGFEPEGTTPGVFAAFIRSEILKYEPVIRRSNIKAIE
jgi:tripartite-type tricarboxylate transporter receptor subunit TctC